MAATTAKIAAGVAGGYLLGRTKKFRLAMMIAGLLAGKKLAADPKAIANKIVDTNPELEHLRGQLTGGLSGAAKELALATAASRIEAMTHTLQDVGDGVGSAANTATGAATSASDDEEDEESADEDSASRGDEKPRKRSSSSGPAKKSSARKRSSSSKRPRRSTKSSASAGR
jgi:hypothetical protein